jgi:hypothetical protein
MPSVANSLIGLLVVATLPDSVLGSERPSAERLLARAARYEPTIVAAARRHGVDPRILWTIAYLETRFRPELTSPAGAGGLCQLMPSTASRFGVTNRYDPTQSIEGAARYVRFLSNSFGGRLDLILAGYNAGEGAVVAFRDGRTIRLANGKTINPRGLRTGGVPPYRETQNYVLRGREVLAGIDRANVFKRSQRAPEETVLAAVPHDVGSDPGALKPALVSRSIYFDGGSPPTRSVGLPRANEIAEVFDAANSTSGRAPRITSESAGNDARTHSIRFR